MKSFLYPALLLLFCVAFTQRLNAQKKSASYQRCATMDRMQIYLKNNPAFKAANETKAKKISGGPDQSGFRLQGIVTIPVVIHIILPNPYVVTDADVQAQIDRLNLDFSGLNADSTNATGFYPIRGRSQIRFGLARRTPAGLLTNGINRRASSTGSDVSESTDPIKRTALGGFDAWNSSQYLNIWVGTDATGQGILGYADNIGPGNSPDDGVVLNIEAFGTSSCYTVAPYNRGRTATHEIGHYLGLYHIWGDDNGGCNGDDFAQLPATTNWALPTGLFNPSGMGNHSSDIGDTPNQANASGSCSGGDVVRDACATLAPGIMYQNYMDYTNDACLTAFTGKQVSRMEWILENCRTGLLTSTGCQIPADAPLLDAAPLSPVNPGGFELSGCQTVFYADSLSCPGTIIPKFRVVNHGLTTVTTLTVGYSYDRGPDVTQTVSVNIPQGGYYVASFPSLAVTVGRHTIRFFTALPNGQADEVDTNDSYVTTITVMQPTVPPLTEDFNALPPLPKWAVDNPHFDFTWMRTTPGRNGAGGKLSIDNYDHNGTRNRDDLRSTSITVNPSVPYILSFDIAYRNYPDISFSDSLAVMVSGDCGQTFTRVYYKGGSTLATSGSAIQSFENPRPEDWRTEMVNISPSLTSNGKIIIVFRNISGFGNWLHLDNISLAKVGERDLRVEAIMNPVTSVCVETFAPVLSIENIGSESVTSFQVGYRIDNGPVMQQSFSQTIEPGGSVSVTLPASTTDRGPHIITAFSSQPVSVSGAGDSRLNNDTLQKTFAVVRLNSPTLTEDFETVFTPQDWTINNQDNNITWLRKGPGKNSRFAVFFDNFNHNVPDQTDDLLTPFLNVAGADSVIVSFDVAHKFFPGVSGPSNDRLTVLSTTDCANSFTPVYNKAGASLATAGSATVDYLMPLSTDWRTERIVLGAAATTSGNLALAFRNTNNFGNNIFLDNIAISAVYKRDLHLVSIRQPGNLVCSSTATPSVILRNAGTETVNGFQIKYTVNNGAPQIHTESGLTLARGSEVTISLPAITSLTAGSYHLKIYIAGLTTSNGSNDLNHRNDTLSVHFSVPGKANAPVFETFAPTAFAPAGWSILNPDGASTWQSFGSGSGNTGSAFFPGFSSTASGEKDDLVSPVISFDLADSVKLTFDLAASTHSFTNGDNEPMDTLEVLVTKDCGNTFTTVYKKWGAELQTTGYTDVPQTTEFFPQASTDWRNEKADLTAFAGGSPVLVFFRITSYNENNLFIDNMRFSTQTLPVQLKQAGLLVFPAPFQNSFTVWHYQKPVMLRRIRVMNTAGQVVWTQLFSGNADSQITVNLTGKPAGVYLVEMAYSDGKKNVVQKVLKQ